MLKEEEGSSGKMNWYLLLLVLEPRSIPRFALDRPLQHVMAHWVARTLDKLEGKRGPYN